MTTCPFWLNNFDQSEYCGEIPFQTSPGLIYGIGVNPYGQLGIGTKTVEETSLVRCTDTGIDFTSISCNYRSSIMVSDTGFLYGIGYTGSSGFSVLGELGSYNGYADVITPTKIGSSSNWASCHGAWQHSIALNDSNVLYGAGSSANGQLGSLTSKDIFGAIASDVAMAVCCRNTTIFVKTDNTIWAAGSNVYGQCGTGSVGGDITTFTQTLAPSSIPWISLAAGTEHVLAVRSDGTLWTWGTNWNGELGRGPLTPGSGDPTPTQVGTDTDWAYCVGGNWHSAAVKTDKTVYATGAGYGGRIFPGADTDSLVFVQVYGGEEVEDVHCSSGANFYLKPDNTVQCTGWFISTEHYTPTTLATNCMFLPKGSVFTDHVVLKLNA